MTRRLVPAGLLVALVAAWPATGGDSRALTKGYRVFICGHSFHMPIAQPLGQMAQAGGFTDHKLAGTQGIGGSTVTKHWEVPDPNNKVRNAIRAKEVDVLTMAPNQLMPDPAIDKYTALLLEHNPNGRVTVQASWMPCDRTFGRVQERPAGQRQAGRSAQSRHDDHGQGPGPGRSD